MRLRHKVIGVLAVSAIGLATVFVVGCGDEKDDSTAQNKNVKIGITQIIAHPALDAAAEGFKQALTDKGYTVEYDMQDAQGDPAIAAQIAQKFAAANLDLILGIATPTSQAVVKADKATPIVFTAVTDPVGAGLVGDAAAPDANVTGVSDMLPMQPHLDQIKAIVPDVKTVGVIYSTSEDNSVFLIGKEKEAAAAMGIEIVEATADKTSEVQAAAQSLVGRVDAISVLTDNTAVTALESIVKVCEENDIPLITGDTDSVKRGAVAAYSFDYKDLGYQAGVMAADILGGKAIKDIPVQFADKLALAINPAAAEAMGVTIPADLSSQAATTY